MSWRDLLQKHECVNAPWIGGESVRLHERCWRIAGHRPQEYGWHKWEVQGRSVTLVGPATLCPDLAIRQTRLVGYLVGDRLIPDGVNANTSPQEILERAHRVYLVERGIEKFSRVAAAQFWCEGKYLFESLDFPTGPEVEALSAFLGRSQSLVGIPRVSPSLDATFAVETWHRDDIERRRREAEELRLEEEKRQRWQRMTGDAAARRQLALEDFGAAAKAALLVGGAEYLDHRDAYQPGETEVTFRMLGRRFTCICNARTLRIVDAGICLTTSNGRFDELFTLETLPSVIREGEVTGQLVILRH